MRKYREREIERERELYQMPSEFLRELVERERDFRMILIMASSLSLLSSCLLSSPSSVLFCPFSLSSVSSLSLLQREFLLRVCNCATELLCSSLSLSLSLSLLSFYLSLSLFPLLCIPSLSSFSFHLSCPLPLLCVFVCVCECV